MYTLNYFQMVKPLKDVFVLQNLMIWVENEHFENIDLKSSERVGSNI